MNASRDKAKRIWETIQFYNFILHRINQMTTIPKRSILKYTFTHFSLTVFCSLLIEPWNSEQYCLFKKKQCKCNTNKKAMNVYVVVLQRQMEGLKLQTQNLKNLATSLILFNSPNSSSKQKNITAINYYQEHIKVRFQKEFRQNVVKNSNLHCWTTVNLELQQRVYNYPSFLKYMPCSNQYHSVQKECIMSMRKYGTSGFSLFIQKKNKTDRQL